MDGVQNHRIVILLKRKNLSKKIRRLEARLQKGTKKLAKLRRKLEAVAASSAAKKKRKSAAIEGRSVAKKVKRKLNLTPERRAQLAAAMKARWAAKRAAAGANTQSPSPEPGFTGTCEFSIPVKNPTAIADTGKTDEIFLSYGTKGLLVF